LNSLSLGSKAIRLTAGVKEKRLTIRADVLQDDPTVIIDLAASQLLFSARRESMKLDF
jgi:hypothetical protein